ncbi:MAG: cytochrome c oxidase subunit 3 [Clostridia bacterium]|nr:cytochrome c oxidase subunit 3 [Clostridia bacterium]MCL6522044.1 cytochrome c oxidase subunit 3 [Bacillota bacterium]
MSSRPLEALQEEEEREAALHAENVRLAFWIWLASEAVFFASLIGVYVALEGRSVSGPTPVDVFDLPMTTVATLDLLLSSLTMVLAVVSMWRRRPGAVKLWLAVTALLGLVFLGFQATEYSSFMRDGLLFNTNVFSASFYTLTGFHGAHVAFGVAWLVGLLISALRGHLRPEEEHKLEVAGLYWHFVDVVWIVIFTVVYVLGTAA